MASLPNCRRRHDGCTVFRVPYSPRWVAGVKTMVPGACREYDPDSKEWAIDPTFAGRVADFTREVYGRLEGEAPSEGRRRAPEPEPIRGSDRHYAELHLLPSAPPPVVRAAYRELARLHHPDRGGNAAAMVRINLAFEAICGAESEAAS